MKKLIIAILAWMPTAFHAQGCDVHLMATPMEQGEDVPERISDILTTRLATAVTATGVTADVNYGQFFVTGKMNHIYKETLPGPPMQFAIHTTLTLYIGDIVNQQVYATKSFDLRGVGNSEERALINALSRLNGKNKDLQDFVQSGKQKIVDHFDKNYTAYLQKARRAASLDNSDEALYHATLIPECSRGYAEASALVLSVYRSSIDKIGKALLLKAKAAWSSHPDGKGAATAFSYLTLIDSEASCYQEALKLGDEIGKTVQGNWTFDHRQKYQDQIELEKHRIAAAKAIGTAWGNGQKEQKTNLMFIK